MRKILINFAHPAKARSKINAALLKAVESLEKVTINDLYEHYPDFVIDVKREQALCETHDVIIFQHPFYWYAAPAIMKEWQDLVLMHGWAYGSKGSKLKNKIFLQTLTAGGDESSYSRQGSNYYTINELTSPLHAMASLCQMRVLPPFAILGIHSGLSKKQMEYHTENYRRLLLALRDETFDFEKVKACKFCNSNVTMDIERF